MTVERLLKMYGKYIEEIEEDGDETYNGDYWCYLAEDYETDEGTISLHDNLKSLQYELEKVKKKYN